MSSTVAEDDSVGIGKVERRGRRYGIELLQLFDAFLSLAPALYTHTSLP